MQSQMDLRFLLPLQPGEHILLSSSSTVLAETLKSERLQVTHLGDCDPAFSLPFPDSAFDHILIPVLTKFEKSFFPGELARILRPNGFLFVGFGNPTALERLLFWRKKNRTTKHSSFSLKRFRRVLNKANLSVVCTYGIQDLSVPQYVVSIENSSPGRFFFEQMFYPHTFTAALAQKAAGAISSMGFHKMLFRNFGIVAKKQKGSMSAESSPFEQRSFESVKNS